MREVEADPHEGKRKSEALWPIFRVCFLTFKRRRNNNNTVCCFALSYQITIK